MSNKKDRSKAGKDPKKERVARGATRLGKALLYVASIVAGCVAVGLIVVLELFKGFSDPQMDSLFSHRDLDWTTTLYYKDGQTDKWEVLQELYYSENREWVDFDEIPLQVRRAIMAIEDERFYEHHGVDWKRFGGAVIGYFTGINDYGGSTITQQLIKNLTEDDDRTWQRKAREVLRALYVERNYGKDEILEYYLNTVYFNYRTYGIEKAAQLYFGKHTSELSLAEAASLVSIVRLPAAYEPYNHPDNNTERKNTVLAKMLELGWISQDEYDAAKRERLSFVPGGGDVAYETVNSYFVDTLVEDLIVDMREDLGLSKTEAEKMIYSGGLKIYTTVDMTVQNTLEAAYCNDENFPKANTDYIYQSASMLMDYHNGHILGVVGGRGEKEESRGLNRATQSERQPGSSVKPLSVYLPALENGVITEGSVVEDGPVYDLGGNPYPQNFARKYYGPTTMFTAIRQSLNATPAQILVKLGYQKSFDFMSKNLHFSTLIESQEAADGTELSDVNLAALAMGAFTYGVTVRDMVAGYGVIASGGIYHEPICYTSVETADGETLLEHDETGERVCTQTAAWLMQDLLVDSVNNGIARPGRLTLPMAAKTGTSNFNYDKWYMGFTPFFVGGVWCGYDEPENMSSAGIITAVPKVIWKNVMQKVVDERGWEDGELAERPEGLSRISVCGGCGRRPGANSIDDEGKSNVFSAWFAPGTFKGGDCTCKPLEEREGYVPKEDESGAAAETPPAA